MSKLFLKIPFLGYIFSTFTFVDLYHAKQLSGAQKTSIMKVFTNIEFTLTPDQQQAIEQAATWAEIDGDVTVTKSSTDPQNTDLVSVYTEEGYKAFDFDLESNQAF
jgi:hypothetical protein